ncbi:MAG: glutathione synthase [Lautropia sp.]|nr:glutathione synthase [Lautropia sp.]
MKLAFIVDPLHKLKIEKDSTVAMMGAAVARGHRLFACEQGQISLSNGRVAGDFAELTLTGETPRWYRAGPAAETALADFDAVLMRKDPPFDMEYVYSTYLLEHAERQGARVVNAPRAVRDNNEKYSITEFPALTTDVLVTRDPGRIREFVARHGEAVLKLLDGMGGASIFRVRGNDPNLSVILETMNQFGSRTVMAQKYLPAISAGDKRILLIGGEVVPYALARVPMSGESRGNLAAGGTGRAQPLSARDREIATTLAPILLTRGLFLVGLDVIGDNLTEINVTSPTCFREIADQTGFDAAGLFIARLEELITGAGGRGVPSAPAPAV